MTPAKREELTLKARAVAEEMQAIISRLLLGVRSHTSLVAEAAPVDINLALEDAIEFWRVDPVFRYDTDVACDLAHHLPPVLCDYSDLKQIIGNLIQNALYAVSHGPNHPGAITLRTRVDDGFVRLELEDNGTGIAPEHLPLIFDPTFTTKPPGEGTGLGLASCYELAVAHGGHMEVVSTLGQGTTMALVLPAIVSHEVA